MNKEIKRLNVKAEKYASKMEKVMEEVSRVIVGQQNVMEKLVIALLANGHVLLEGVPGLAKTLMIKTLAETLNAKFVRIQFTPDLLPADIMGTKIYNHKDMKFITQKGPVFANFILADEINRAPPKTQAAMLEAMQERQVTIQGETFALPKPFFVMATQNPIESSGTYPLPEAQVDRFMFKTLIEYPDRNEEKVIINRMTEGRSICAKKIIDIKELTKMQQFVQQIYADDKIKEYVTGIVDATRKPKEYGIDVDNYIEYGASPRASIWLILAAKAHALLNGRGYVLPEDVKAIAWDVLRHRVILNYEAEAEGVTIESIIEKILAEVKMP